MKKISSFLVSLLFVIVVKAQKNAEFVSGYIINIKNDTLKGEIRLNPKNEMEYYAKINFRDQPSHPVRAYLPNKINGYGMEEKEYSSVKILDIWVFMQIVCKGSIMFFEYKPPVALGNDKMKSQYFILKGGMTDIEQFYIEGKIKKQLKEYISDDKELLKELDSLSSIDYGTLVNFIERYNERNKT